MPSNGVGSRGSTGFDCEEAREEEEEVIEEEEEEEEIEEDKDEEETGFNLPVSSICVAFRSLKDFTKSILSYTAQAAASTPLLTFFHVSTFAAR